MNINTSQVCLLLTVLGVFSMRERTLGVFSGAPWPVKKKKGKIKRKETRGVPSIHSSSGAEDGGIPSSCLGS